jgi:uncharacterized membrane protein AbrB (regulator of aidB expression)
LRGSGKQRIALAILISLELLCLSSLSALSTYRRQNVDHPAALSRLLSTSPAGLVGQMCRIGKDYRAYLFKPGTRKGVFDSFLTMIGVVAAATLAGTGLYRLKDLHK